MLETSQQFIKTYPKVIPNESRRHPERIPKASRRIRVIFPYHITLIHVENLLPTSFQPAPDFLPACSQLPPCLLPTSSQPAPTFLPTSSQLAHGIVPRNCEEERISKQATTARLLPQISLFTHKKHFCGELW